jgi:hypothetical protein
MTKRPSVGDTITYEPLLGGTREIVVTVIEDDIKNGRSGFEGYLVADPTYTVWGYEYQIVSA